MKRSMIIGLILFVLLSGLLSGCTIGVSQSTLDTINKAIDTLEAQPGAWKAVLNDTIDHLSDKTTETAKSIQNLLNDSVGFVGVEARCNTDFLGKRIRDALIYIRDKILLNKSDVAKPPPYVCHVSPDVLLLKWNAAQQIWETSTPEVRLFGFDFTYAGLPTVEMHDAMGHFVRPARLTPSLSTKYEVLLNFQTEDFSRIRRGYRYTLKWGGTIDPNEIDVTLQPPPLPTCAFTTTSVPPSSTVSCRSIQQPPGLVYEIDQPVVNQATAQYRMITFMPREIVTVDAGGCVQTGGAGSTWKLYVDPRGDNSDRYYFGLISIPGTPARMIRIWGVINRPLTVSGYLGGNNTLILGYVDNDYGDNGYYAHDNGTGNQCLGVGNAWVRLTVQFPMPPM